MPETVRRRFARKLPGPGRRIDVSRSCAPPLAVRGRTVTELQATVRKEQAARKRAQERLAADRPEIGDTTPPSFRRNLINSCAMSRNGRPLRNLHGLHPSRNYYPEDHLSHSDKPQGLGGPARRLLHVVLRRSAPARTRLTAPTGSVILEVTGFARKEQFGVSPADRT